MIVVAFVSSLAYKLSMYFLPQTILQWMIIANEISTGSLSIGYMVYSIGAACVSSLALIRGIFITAKPIWDFSTGNITLYKD